MEISFNYPNKCLIPHYGSLVENEVISNYKEDREKFLNSLKHNTSTSLSSYPIYTNYNYTIPSRNLNLNNDLLFSKDNNNMSRSKSPCFCNCHLKKNDFISYPCKTEFSSFFLEKSNELNHDLMYKVNELKNSLKKFESDLNKTNSVKKENDSYKKTLEKEFSLSKINKSFKEFNYKIKDNNSLKNKNNNNNNNESKSINISNSIPNKNKNSRLEEKSRDYNNIIETQTKWLDSLSNNQVNKPPKNNFRIINKYNSFYSNNPNINNSYNFKYFKNILDLNNNSNINNNQLLYRDNSFKKKNLNLDCNYNFDYSNYTINTINKENNNNKYPSYSVNNNKEEEFQQINKRINMSKVNKDNINTINNNKLIYNEDLNLSNQNNRYTKNYDKDIKKNELEKNNSSKERYIILDINGNPIFINGKKLLGMAFKEYKGIKDNSKKNIFENQNDEVNYIKNLKPI